MVILALIGVGIEVLVVSPIVTAAFGLLIVGICFAIVIRACL